MSVSSVGDLALLRQYEPVLCFTQGELFLPMLVEDYLAWCGLWALNPAPEAEAQVSPVETQVIRVEAPLSLVEAETSRPQPRRRRPVQLATPGELDPDRLAELGRQHGGAVSLRFVESPLDRAALRAWRRDPQQPRFRRTGRFAAVGLLGRLIDATMRLSLVIRGRVPGGTAAAAHVQYSTHPLTTPYYGRVTRDGGYLVLQYWFLYAMNDWRSTYAGVNDHEADWEQITLFLPAEAAPASRPTWVAFSSHDETGADLRRRSDDPDIDWVGNHPVVYVGAGSHSGSYLPGEYLVSVQPPGLRRLSVLLRRVTSALLPWVRGRSGTALGIPFIDYRRGDGTRIGPDQPRSWTPVLVDDETPWVRDYRGLWGLDTGDPLGGERAPAGPRYERTTLPRECWVDPVGWADLDRESPTAAQQRCALAERLDEIDDGIWQAEACLDDLRRQARREREGQRALRAMNPGTAAPAGSARYGDLAAVRNRRAELRREREAVTRALQIPIPPEPPHAHLRHRPVPDVDLARTPSRRLRLWSSISVSLLLIGLAIVLLDRRNELFPALLTLLAVMLLLEAFARGRLLQFILNTAGIVLAGAVALSIAAAFVENWRLGTAILLIGAAAVLLVANLRDFLVNRQPMSPP